MRSVRTSRCSHNKSLVPYHGTCAACTGQFVDITPRCVTEREGELRSASPRVLPSASRLLTIMIALVLVAAPSLQISRRALAAPAAAALVSQYAAACEAVVGGSACLGDASCGMDSRAGARLAATPVGEKAGIRFGGSYSDANHPGCARRITLAGTSALISGTDEDGTPFKARGTVAGKTLTVDLGGAALVGTWNGLGIVFSDGNTWTKK